MAKSKWFSILPPVKKVRNPLAKVGKNVMPGYKPYNKRKEYALPTVTPKRSFEAGTIGRLPGRTRSGSRASFVKVATAGQRASMGEIVRKYNEIIRRLVSVTPDAVRDALQPVYDKSQDYVPKRSGDLMYSGQMDVIENPNSGRVRGYIKYGDATAWYAALVHEMTWLKHKEPTRAKYLQNAMEEELDQFLSRLAVSYAIGKVW